MGSATEMLRRVEAVWEDLDAPSVSAENILEAYYNPSFKDTLKAQTCLLQHPSKVEVKARIQMTG